MIAPACSPGPAGTAGGGWRPAIGSRMIPCDVELFPHTI
jgi:hypothetical protein